MSHPGTLHLSASMEAHTMRISLVILSCLEYSELSEITFFQLPTPATIFKNLVKRLTEICSRLFSRHAGSCEVLDRRLLNVEANVKTGQAPEFYGRKSKLWYELAVMVRAIDTMSITAKVIYTLNLCRWVYLWKCFICRCLVVPYRYLKALWEACLGVHVLTKQVFSMLWYLIV